MAKIRSFLALEIPEKHRDQIAALQQGWLMKLPPTRWANPANLHLTMKFLGSVENARLDRLADELEKAVAGLGEISVIFDRLGCFPSPKRARVAWIGGRAEGADTLVARIEDVAETIDFPREKRPWSMHLTVARLRKPWPVSDAEKFVLWGNYLDFEPFVCRELVLFESDLRPSGAVYKARARFGLAGQ